MRDVLQGLGWDKAPRDLNEKCGRCWDRSQEAFLVFGPGRGQQLWVRGGRQDRLREQPGGSWLQGCGFQASFDQQGEGPRMGLTLAVFILPSKRFGRRV